jgi:hypothetical protein
MKQMKKLLAVALLVVPLLAAGCTTTATTATPTVITSTTTTSEVVTGTLVPSVEMPVPGPSSTMYPDDIVSTPGGYAYRGNVHQQGEVNPWPEVKTVEKSILVGSVRYRADITSNAGQVRNDLVTLTTESVRTGNHTLDLYAAGVPAGFTLERSAGAGLPGQVSARLRIAIGDNVAPGDYSFTLGLTLDGVFGGFVPVTVHVVTQTVNTPTAPVTTP